jgi:hypothetical protein
VQVVIYEKKKKVQDFDKNKSKNKKKGYKVIN